VIKAERGRNRQHGTVIDKVVLLACGRWALSPKAREYRALQRLRQFLRRWAGHEAFGATSGPLFFITNTRGIITLKNVKASAASGVLVKAGVDRWGRTGSNGGNAVFTADGETLAGDLVADAGCSVRATLQNGTTLAGAIKDAALTIDATSKWTVTADSTLTTLTDAGGVSGLSISNIVGNGHNVHYDAGLAANKWLEGKTYTLSGGGQLLPKS